LRHVSKTEDNSEEDEEESEVQSYGYSHEFTELNRRLHLVSCYFLSVIFIFIYSLCP